MLAVLLFVGILLSVHRNPTQPITVRHVKSVHAGNVTTMTFEMTNHTADAYVWIPFGIQVRDGDTWTEFQSSPVFVDTGGLGDIAPREVVSCRVNVTNLSANSVVRLSITTQKLLSGVEAIVEGVKWSVKHHGNAFNSRIVPNFYGNPTEIFSEQWVETAK